MKPSRWIVHLGRFFALGALLLGARRLLVAPGAAESAPLVVTVPPDADEAEVGRAVADAALIDLALAARWPMGDPVVRDLLLSAMRADDPHGDAEALITRGIELGMTRRDPATRARLAWLGREIVRARVRTVTPSAAVLAAYRAAHRDRYEDGWIVLQQRVISWERHGDAAEAEAARLLAALALAGATAEVAGGDPSLLPARMAGTPALIDARFGAGFAAQLAEAPAGRWSGPYRGSFGYHVVWLEARSGRAAADQALQQRIVRDWHQDQVEAEVRRAIDAIVKRRAIDVRRGTP